MISPLLLMDVKMMSVQNINRAISSANVFSNSSFAAQQKCSLPNTRCIRFPKPVYIRWTAYATYLIVGHAKWAFCPLSSSVWSKYLGLEIVVQFNFRMMKQYI